MATLEELEQRVADLEQYVEEQAIHTLSWSAEQIDAFFALLESRVFTSGRKTIEITDNSTGRLKYQVERGLDIAIGGGAGSDQHHRRYTGDFHGTQAKLRRAESLL